MKFVEHFLILLAILFTFSCSSSYEQLKSTKLQNSNILAQHIAEKYKIKAIFEAEEMHDWNSAKLYSEKALLAAKGVDVFPEDIKYWRIPKDKILEISKAHQNLNSIYKISQLKDPENLAKAIVALDCWSEQQEESWQNWDILKCKNDFLNATHKLYNQANLEKKINTNTDNITMVTKNANEEILQIIYFDFDNSNLSSFNKTEIEIFLNINRNLINKYIITGHTDTRGSKTYNYKLSVKRAESIKKLLISKGILKENINILGYGEDNLKVKTKDEFAHPANRRAEISLFN